MRSLRFRVWVRYITGGLLTVCVVAMVALAIQRARLLQAPERAVIPDGIVDAGDEDAVGVYTDLEYVERVEGQKVFSLRSGRSLGLSSGWHEIEEVLLQLYRGRDDGPLLTSEAASFNVESHDARLRGQIQVAFPGGGILSAETGRFDAKTRRFVTDSEVVYAGDEGVGRAGSAAYFLESNRLVLEDGVIMKRPDGVQLEASRVVYRRDAGRIQMPDGFRLTGTGSEIVAEQGSVDLNANGSPSVIRMGGGVDISSTDGESMSAWAERLVAERDASGNWQVEATTSADMVRVEFRGTEEFLLRRIESWLLRAVVSPSEILQVRAEEQVCLEEIPVEGSPRRAEARSGQVWFEDGRPTDIELVEDVVIRGEDVTGRGALARMSSRTEIVMLHSDPLLSDRVVIESDRGTISADQAHLFQAQGRTEARGDVQGQLEDAVLLESAPGEEAEPLRFAGDVLEVRGDGQVLMLIGQTRSWQGQRLLVADEVVYRGGEGKSIEATGHVRTTLPATQLEPEASPGEDMVVVARALRYSGDEQQAVYRGDVVLTTPTRQLSASRVIVFFSGDSRVAAVEAVGAVEIIDRATGRTFTGQTARHDQEAGTIVLEGEPARLEDSKGNVVSGASLTWYQADGRVTVAGDTETIYYPEETP